MASFTVEHVSMAILISLLAFCKLAQQLDRHELMSETGRHFHLENFLDVTLATGR